MLDKNSSGLIILLVSAITGTIIFKYRKPTFFGTFLTFAIGVVTATVIIFIIVIIGYLLMSNP